MSIHLIVIGKLKDKNLEAIENEYLKRLKSEKLTLHELKSNSENIEQESKSILKKLSEIGKIDSSYLVALSEHGKNFDSLEFSTWISKKQETYQQLIFLISGAEGYGEDILKKVHCKISLSKMTFPHKLARIIFVEQLYRAMTIRDGHPYHN